jgi:hypothetical protein
MTWRDQQVVRLTFQPYRVDPAGRVLRTSTRLVVRVAWPATPTTGAVGVRGLVPRRAQLSRRGCACAPAGPLRQAFTPGVPVYKIVIVATRCTRSRMRNSSRSTRRWRTPTAHVR